MQSTTFTSRTRFTFTLTFLLLGLGGPAWPGDEPQERSTLKGIPVIQVLVAPMSSDAERDGLTHAQLHTDVEVRLRKAGIRLPSPSSIVLPALYLTVRTLKRSPSQTSVYVIQLEFLQDVTLVRNRNVSLLAATWSTGYFGEVGADRFSRLVRDNVADLVDQFINAYLEQNPKQ